MKMNMHLKSCSGVVRGMALAAALACVGSALVCQVQAQSPESVPEQVMVNTRAEGTPLPHFWEQMFGSGRAVLALRDDWRKDLATVHQATGFRYVRFHGIFDHEVGVYDEDKDGKPVYNWSYVDQIYDNLLAEGVRPYVELSFMPEKMASQNVHQAFWYQPNPSPPASYAKWDAMITAFAQHLVARYGIDEVSQWYFEVWNEPNLDFWVGKPAQQSYFELYDNTAKALKAVNLRLRVGGPATAQAAWIPAMIEHASKNDVPLDFVSTHVYGNDIAANVFPSGYTFAPKTPVPPHQMVAAAVKAVHEQILHSAMPHIPLIWSEFNATYANEQPITDSIYMGPWMADIIRQCDGEVQSMSYWSFSDVFEEQGVVKTPFYGGYGLIAERDIPKPAFLVFSLLHTLGSTRIPVEAKDVLATRRADGTLVIAAWNMAEPPGATVADKDITLDLSGMRVGGTATVRRVDAEHRDTLDAWKQMGSPAFPTREQIAALKKVGTLAEPEPLAITGDKLTVHLPSSGLAVIEVKP
jgi:xylan 1,4-beta-xylosidase